MNRIEYVEHRKNFEVVIATTAEGEAGWVYIFGQAIPDFGLTVVEEFLGREDFIGRSEISEAHAGFAVFHIGGLLQHELRLVLPPYGNEHCFCDTIVQRNKDSKLVLWGKMKTAQKSIARLEVIDTGRARTHGLLLLEKGTGEQVGLGGLTNGDSVQVLERSAELFRGKRDLAVDGNAPQHEKNKRTAEENDLVHNHLLQELLD